jgi:hypothetical protein
MTAPTKTSAFQLSRYIWKGPALSEARSLPANCYASEAFFKAEVENIHARGWIIGISCSCIRLRNSAARRTACGG